MVAPSAYPRLPRTRTHAASRAAMALAGFLGLAMPGGVQGLTRGGCGYRAGVLTNGDRRLPEVALTFDMCPTSHHPGFASEIVALLEDRRIPATFFISGAWATAHPGALHALAATDVFELALHGNRHRHLRHLSALGITEEIESGREALHGLGVTPAPLFRPPYGETPAALGAAAEQAGVHSVLWDVVSGDPDPHLTSSALERRVLRRVRNGSIVVMHANGAGIRSARDLAVIVDTLQQRGYALVSVGTMLEECRAPRMRRPR